MNEQINTANFILVVLAIWVIYNLVNYIVIRSFIHWLYDRYRKEAATLVNDSNIHENFKNSSTLKQERATLEILANRRSHKFDLSIVISNIEFILIAGSTALVLNSFVEKIDYVSFFSKVGIVALSWLGIKVLGYSGHWKQPIFGRSTFSVFLFGSIINIGIGFLAGLILAGIY